MKTSPIALRSLAMPALLSCALLAAGCGDSSSADPETLVKGDLNPPAALVSVTGEESMLLQFTVTNTEDDIVGYNVYVAEGTIAEGAPGSLQGLLKGKAAGFKLATQQIRRCKDTADVFKAFGFSATADQAKTECDDFGDDARAAAPAAASGAAGDDTSANLTEGDAAPTFVPCTDLGNKAIDAAGKVSIDIAKAVDVDGEALPKDPAKRVGKQLVCNIPKGTRLSDGKTGFTSGKRYVAFVVAVQGDDADEISYTSNFVEDSPANYTKLSFANLASGAYLPLELGVGEGNALSGAFTRYAANENDVPQADVSGSCSTPPNAAATSCRLGDQLDFGAPAAGPRFALVGDTTTGSERVFVAGEKDKVVFSPAQARVDYANGRPGIRAPGDKAIEYTPGGEGKVFFSSNQAAPLGSLFYVAAKNPAGTWHYGKLYVQDLKTTAGTGGVAAGAGLKSGTIWFALQPQPNLTFVETASGAGMGAGMGTGAGGPPFEGSFPSLGALLRGASSFLSR